MPALNGSLQCWVMAMLGHGVRWGMACRAHRGRRAAMPPKNLYQQPNSVHNTPKMRVQSYYNVVVIAVTVGIPVNYISFSEETIWAHRL